MKILTKSYDIREQNLIRELASKVGVLNSTAEILYGRGYDTEDKVRNFLSPDKWERLSPFTLSGMADAVARIKQARDNDETVVIYGDYDVDGICATTVLYKALKIFGIDAYTVIPERENGYGLTEGVLNEVLDAYYPSLIITVDCGISAKLEVENLKDLAVDVIVTDHHEFPEEIPETIIVSTKTKGQDYPFEYLSGAGVAYKLASALIGDRADDFLDLVALATIADSMPLVGENRNIVYHGIELIKNGKCSQALISLLYASGAREISAIGLSFSVVPRINAAGRMGDARSALQLFLTESQKEREELTEKLSRYNSARQQECEVLYADAKEKLKTHGNYGKAILLYDKSWKSGLLGIVAARLTEEFSLPTILFAEFDGALHGSARSNGEISVYDAIASASDLLVDYGGHSQAAGVTVKEENFEEFARRLNSFVESNYDSSSFEKTVEVEYVLNSPFTLRFAREIAKLEPFGLGNKKPILLTVEEGVSARPLKAGSPHISIKTPKIELVHFNGVKYLKPLTADIEKSILFESSISAYNGKEQAKGIVKTIDFEFVNSEELVLLSLKNALVAVKGEGMQNYSEVDSLGVGALIDGVTANGSGTLFVLTNPCNFNFYKGLKDFTVCPFTLTVSGGKNAVLIGGNLSEADLSLYETVIYLDKPFKVYGLENQRVIVCNKPSFDESLFRLSRDEMGIEFRIIKEFALLKRTWLEIVKDGSNSFVTAFALETFKELGFFGEDDAVFMLSGAKNDLLKSKIYSKFMEN
ncbi:MAG: single-stranded-DNA-specific exonuclease RecJ [Clostridia bacterium]|nr:single-stranded-DNA-specific exonuclease RecJ [Clostridia bacterium]